MDDLQPHKNNDPHTLHTDPLKEDMKDTYDNQQANPDPGLTQNADMRNQHQDKSN